MSAAQQPHGYLLELDTRKFAFQAFGRTEEEAIETMGRALNRHAEQYGLASDWSDVYEYRTTPIVFGSAYRDNERLIEA